MISEQSTALEAMFRGENCFLTGVAGTGKSYVIREFCRKSIAEVSITASTGIAALNIGGMTVHRFTGIGLGPRPEQDHKQFAAGIMADHRFFRAAQRIRYCKILVIDEISMLTGRTLDFIDYMMRQVRHDKRPFGGVQVIVVGDFLQLAPVRKDVRENYDWAFLAKVWKEANFTNIYLQKIYRQDEGEFVGTLNDFRNGTISERSRKLLEGRVIDFPDEDIPRLMTHNAQVDNWNKAMVKKLPGSEYVFKAETEGPDFQVEYLERNLITPKELVLKPGALVITTANSKDANETEFVNGEMGKVMAISNDMVTVQTARAELQVTPYTWQYDWQDDFSATFRQFPLRLGYALTIHKAQGLTLDRALVDIRAAREPGQAYVALSRVRSVKGLYLHAWFKAFSFSRTAKQFYEELA